MNTDIARETLGALASGAFWYGYFRYGHRSALHNNRTGYYFITAPSWLAILCGRPLPDDKLELVHMLGQIGGLLLSIIWLPMYWSGLDRFQRFNVFAACMVSVLTVPMAAYAIVAAYRRLH